MRFKLGLIAGAGIGYWLAARSEEQKRRDLEHLVERLRSEPLVGQLREVVSETVSGATQAATRRFTGSGSGTDPGSGTGPGTGPSVGGMPLG